MGRGKSKKNDRSGVGAADDFAYGTMFVQLLFCFLTIVFSYNSEY